MSNRFGRNQKRKLKAELAIEQDKSAELSREITRLINDPIRQKHRMILEVIERTLEPSSLVSAIANGAAVMNAPLHDHELPIKHISGTGRAAPTRGCVQLGMSAMNVDLLHCVFAEHRRTFNGQTVFKLRFKDESSMYAMNDQAFKAAPIEWIAEDIAVSLVKYIKEQGCES